MLSYRCSSCQVSGSLYKYTLDKRREAEAKVKITDLQASHVSSIVQKFANEVSSRPQKQIQQMPCGCFLSKCM